MRPLSILIMFSALAMASAAGEEGAGSAPKRNSVMYEQGGSCCEHVYGDGKLWSIVRRSDYAVAASLSDTGKKLVLHVFVGNGNAHPFDVLPSAISLRLQSPKVKYLKSEDPGRLAHSIQRSAERWSRFDEGLAANQKQQTTARSTNSGQAQGNTDYYDQYGRNVGTANSRGTYTGQTNTIVTTPDYEAQRQAAMRTGGRMSRAGAATDQILRDALRAQTVAAGEMVGGDVIFERDGAARKKGNLLYATIPIGDTDYVFPFHFQ